MTAYSLGIVSLVSLMEEFLRERTTRKRLYVKQGEDYLAPEQLARRLANGLNAAPHGKCWDWTKRLNNEGYGGLRVGPKMVLAHRLCYFLAFGPIPDGLLVCHRCDNPKCINPHHLFAGTNRDNLWDSISKGRRHYQQKAKK